MRGVLRKITELADIGRIQANPNPEVRNEVTRQRDESDIITQAWLWPRVGEYLRENDVVVSETGTANFGLWETKFPPGCVSLNQTLWGSIGWSVGACQGAALAVKDAGQHRRTILWVGDGSFQLTAQEVSTMIRRELDTTM